MTAALTLTFASPARADLLQVETEEGESGYVAVTELSYETIVEPGDDHDAMLRLRVALHNGSSSMRDVVHTLVVPANARLEGLRVAADGIWKDGRTTLVDPVAERRDAETAFARLIPADEAGLLPAVQLVAFGLPPDTTRQLEVVLRVYPRHVGDRREIDLPSRGLPAIGMQTQRRVLVASADAEGAVSFFVDGESNRGAPYMITRSTDAVTVGWPASARIGKGLSGRLEVMPNASGVPGGRFELYLQLGHGAAMRPDHVLVLVDRSKSVPSELAGDVAGLLPALLQATGKGTNFDVVAFAREAHPVLEGPASAHDEAAVVEAQERLRTLTRQHGTNLHAAIETAVARLENRSARRPVVFIFTDGAFATRVDQKALARLRKRLPAAAEIVLVVDDPLHAPGMPLDEHLASVASALSARLRMISLGRTDADGAAALLGAPRLLGDLSIELPRGAKLSAAAPHGLVGGDRVVLRGNYAGRPPTYARITGRSGRKRVSHKLRALRTAPTPEAFAATVPAGDLEVAASEGFVLPPWYGRDAQRAAQHSVEQSSRTRELVRRGYLDRAVIGRYLTQRVLPRARVCYNHALLRNRDQTGRVKLEIEVGKGETIFSGLAQSELSHPDDALTKCLVEAGWALEVPASVLDDSVYIVRYPLRLVPPKDDQPWRVMVLDDPS